MQKLVFRNANGIELDLTSDPFGITEWEGFSAVDLNVQSQQVPFQDGSVYLDGLLGERELSVTVAMQDKNNLEKRYQLRRQLISVLNPKLGEGVLIYTNDYISKQIHCVAQMPVFENHNSNDSGTPKISCSFTACNPYWEDLEETEISFSSDEAPIVKNEGDIPIGMNIKMIGEETENPVIENITTQKKIEYKDTIGTLTINTNTGSKGVSLNTDEFNKVKDAGNFLDLIYVKNKGLFCGVKSSGAIAISYDGKRWTYKTVSDESLHSICYAEEKELFVVVGDRGVIYTSKDLSNFEKQESGTEYGLLCVKYSSDFDCFFASGEYSIILKSSDGSTWSTENVSERLNSFTSIYCDTNIILVMGGGYYATMGKYTTDGSTWENMVFDADEQEVFGSIIKKDGTYYAFSESLFTSSDGINWVHTSNSVFKVAYSEETMKYLGIKYSSGISETVIYESTDLLNWTEKATLAEQINVILWTEKIGGFITAGESNFIAISKDEENWTSYQTDNFDLQKVIYSDKYKCFVFVGDDGGIFTYNDKEGLIQKTSGTTSTLYSICYSKKLDLFVAVGGRSISDGVILKSSNLTDWEIVQENIRTIRQVVYSEELEMFVATQDNFIYSTDGETWNDSGVQIAQASSLKLGKDCIFEYEYRGGAENTKYRKTTDGITWTTQASLSNVFDVSTIKYIADKEKYYGVYKSNSTYYFAQSDDGIVWNTVSKIPYTISSRDLCYDDVNKVMNILNQKSVISSADLEVWSSKDFVAVNNGEYIICLNGEKWIFSYDYFMKNDVILQNKIDKLSQDSDIGMELIVGENQMNSYTNKGYLYTIITYRQKYIGV